MATDAVFESPESPPPIKKQKTEDTVISSRPAQKGIERDLIILSILII